MRLTALHDDVALEHALRVNTYGTVAEGEICAVGEMRFYLRSRLEELKGQSLTNNHLPA